jgi:two-component system cell cycle response regulator CpdR
MPQILLAEDDESMRRFLVKALERAGHDVVAFDNGAEAYEALRASELHPEMKIMFITGFAAVALHPDARAPREARILSKPVHLRELVQEVDRLLAA